MNLYLLRHGEAENHAVSDSSRALTDRGRCEVKTVALQFAAKNLPLDRCFVSPYVRAQQTAELFISQYAGALTLETELNLTPDIRALQVIAFLETIKQESEAENILLVSHNPLMSELFALLTQSGIANMKIINTSELNCISLDIIAPGMGTSQFSLYPSNLSAFENA